jgi:hypothetical protein
MIKEHLNTIISILIVLIFGILSIEFQNMIGAFSYIYMPICLFILLKNLNNENFNFKILTALTLVLLNEFLIRILGDIKLNSSGNPWASLFFILMLITSFITIISIIIIKKNKIVDFLSKIIFIITFFLIVLVTYIIVFLIQ